MPRNFARHEQFLRIFALLEILSNARHPLDDQSIIAAVKDRLGLGRLSARTLRRDCDFLCSCGYPVDHIPLHDGRKYGWQLSKDSVNGRKIPSEPLTLLELVAFMVGRDFLRSFEGTILWTGIESLWHKIEREVPVEMLKQLEAARGAFHVRRCDPSRYAARPRLISTLSGAIIDCQEIEVEQMADDGRPPVRLRLQPLRLVIEPPAVRLLAIQSPATNGEPPLLIDIETIGKVTTRDVTFVPPPADSIRVE
jgi:predicted DNA-binding transcriptional regulator YafY